MRPTILAPLAILAALALTFFLASGCGGSTTGAGLASDHAQPHGGLYSSATDSTELDEADLDEREIHDDGSVTGPVVMRAEVEIAYGLGDENDFFGATTNAWPVGTVLTVERLDDGTAVQVEVQQREPLEDDALLAVDEEAARLLGIMDQGVLEMRVAVARRAADDEH